MKTKNSVIPTSVGIQKNNSIGSTSCAPTKTGAKSVVGPLVVVLSLFGASWVYAQKPPKPPAQDALQETKKLKEELDASKAEVARLNEELKKLQTQLEEAKKANSDDITKQQEAINTLTEEVGNLLTARDAASDLLSSVTRDATNANRVALATRGMSNYKRYCSTCHGEDGKGKGTSASFLDQTPRDFTRGTYKFKTTPSGALPTTEDLARSIRVGAPGTSMPGWGKDLSTEEITELAAVLETFSPRFVEEDPSQGITIPQAPANLKTLAPAGRAFYLAFGCNQCHGDKGKGDGPSRALKDETGQKILATNFTKGVFKSGYTDGDLYRAVSTGLDGTPMPSYYDAILLSRAELEQLAEKLPAAEAKAMKDFAQTQPEEAPAADSPEAEARRWAMVAYVRSLAKKRGFFDWLKAPVRRYDVER